MLFFSKASILLLYYRAFKPMRWLRICVWVLLVIMFCVYWMTGNLRAHPSGRPTASTLPCLRAYRRTAPLCFNYCMPHNGDPWDLNVLMNCNHLATPGLVQAAINIAVDIAIFVLPLPVITKLHVPTGKKVALVGVFATGLL